MVTISLLMEMGQFDHSMLEAYMVADWHQLVSNYVKPSFFNPPSLREKIDPNEVS
jgi:hypothetical protein